MCMCTYTYIHPNVFYVNDRFADDFHDFGLQDSSSNIPSCLIHIHYNTQHLQVYIHRHASSCIYAKYLI